MNLDPSSWPPLVWLVAAVALLAGYGLGIAFSRRGRGTARIRELERQLDDTRDQFDAYREQVSGHFTDTSKHLRDLALQYRTVYEHLAEGARTLCPDSAVPIEARGLAKELLPAEAHAEGVAAVEGEASTAAGEPQTSAELPGSDRDPQS